MENQSNILPIKLANMIFTRDNGKYCGTDIIKYPYKIINKKNNYCTIGYVVLYDYWGKGYTTEATIAVSNYFY